jgi:hypothetical protein
MSYTFITSQIKVQTFFVALIEDGNWTRTPKSRKKYPMDRLKIRTTDMDTSVGNYLQN